MPSPMPARTEIARWPKINATLHPDGAGTLTIDGRTHELKAGDLAASRTAVLERVTATAATVGRPVRLHSTDPDGDWQLAVHPDGRVDELDASPAPDATRDTAPPATAAASTAAAPVHRASPPGQRRGPRRRATARIAATIALLVLCGAIALVLTRGPDTVVHAPNRQTSTATILAPSTAQDDAVAAGNADAHRKAAQRKARRAAAAKKRRQRAALEHRVAVRQARDTRAAHRRAGARQRAAAARRPSTPTQSRPRATPLPPVHRTPPPPPPAADCGEFDIC